MKPTKLTLGEHAIVQYYHHAEFGTSLDDALKPEYWSHVAPSLREGHRVEVLAADASWWASLLVRAVGRTEALMGVILHVEFDGEAEPLPDDMPYEVKWRGPHAKFGVIRKDGGEVVKDEFPTKPAAAKWLAGHMQALAR